MLMNRFKVATRNQADALLWGILGKQAVPSPIASNVWHSASANRNIVDYGFPRMVRLSDWTAA